MRTHDNSRLEIVREKAQQWEKELIDLDHRNSLLNFKNTKTGSLALTECDPDTLSGLIAGRKTGLRTLFASEQSLRDASMRARSLMRRMIAFREEQGVDVGRLACGLVKTRPLKVAGARPVLPLRAPLLLRSIEIHPKTAAESDFTLQVGMEPEINPVLLHGLQREYGFDFDLEEIVGKINSAVIELADVDEQVERAFTELSEHGRRHGVELELEPIVVAGLFNYQKLPMVQDLQSATALLAEHDLIAAIAGHETAAQEIRDSGASFVAPEPDTIEPTHEYLAHDTNSSQHRAIETALAGHHLLIEGPPGTGKSQTIANLIASAAARGKRVLFVAEKRAAIEAVTDRLAEVGLDDLVLDLHASAGVKKKHVAKQLSESLSKATQQRSVDVTSLHRQLIDRRQRLSSFVTELHRSRDPWGLSAYDVREQLLRIHPEHVTSCRFLGSRLHALDAATAQAVEEGIRDLIDQGGLRVIREETPWARAEVASPDDARRVLYELDELASNTLHNSADRMNRLVGQVGLPVPQEIARWQQVLSLLDGVTTSVRTFGPEVFGEHLDALYAATAPRPDRARLTPKLSWRERRAWVKQAKQMCRSGLKKKGDLHQALGEVMQQRNSWRELGGPESQPAEVIGLDEMMTDYQNLRQQLASVALSARVGELESQPTAQVRAKLDELCGDRNLVFHLPRIHELRRWLGELGLTELVGEIARSNVSPDEAQGMFRHAWLSSLDDEFKFASQALREFTPEQQDRLVEEFQQADKEHLGIAPERVRRKVALALRKARDDYPAQAELLEKEASKKTRHLALRKLVERAPNVLLSLRPCWAMSPLVVSQTLPAKMLFDLVIFDEASQIKPHDAITSIMRGHRLAVAGDEKQLPPSRWFDRATPGDDEDEGENADLGDYESILTSLRPVLAHRCRLQWHYRSQDERLIAFSNREMYDGSLVTFPGARQVSPVRLEVVDGTVSPGQGGLPVEELNRVVELIIEHAEQRPGESLGVITLGVKHEARVEKALREALRDRRDLDDFVSEEAGPTHRFFVKNIETVQGDERDAIILSLGVAPRANGVISRSSFGALNHEGTERRVNVAVTRAKRRMTVVTSFPPSALEPSDRVNGTEMLRRYLVSAEHAGDPASVGRSSDADLNGFERDIERRLADAGIVAHPQWGVSDYCIDFALAHPSEPGRMVLAVEADGDSYHRSRSARDRDRLRQEHLERLGWRFHRVWASAWFTDPDAEMRKITEAWRDAVADVDSAGQDQASYGSARPLGLRTPSRLEKDHEGSTQREGATPADPVPRRESRPEVSYGLLIDEYSDHQLIGLCRWLISDGLPLDRQERVRQAMRELGFQKRGRKIRERLERAVDVAQALADKDET